MLGLHVALIPKTAVNWTCVE